MPIPKVESLIPAEDYAKIDPLLRKLAAAFMDATLDDPASLGLDKAPPSKVRNQWRLGVEEFIFCLDQHFHHVEALPRDFIVGHLKERFLETGFRATHWTPFVDFRMRACAAFASYLRAHGLNVPAMEERALTTEERKVITQSPAARAKAEETRRANRIEKDRKAAEEAELERLKAERGLAPALEKPVAPEEPTMPIPPEVLAVSEGHLEETTPDLELEHGRLPAGPPEWVRDAAAQLAAPAPQDVGKGARAGKASPAPSVKSMLPNGASIHVWRNSGRTAPFVCRVAADRLEGYPSVDAFLAEFVVPNYPMAAPANLPELEFIYKIQDSNGRATQQFTAAIINPRYVDRSARMGAPAAQGQTASPSETADFLLARMRQTQIDQDETRKQLEALRGSGASSNEISALQEKLGKMDRALEDMADAITEMQRAPRNDTPPPSIAAELGSVMSVMMPLIKSRDDNRRQEAPVAAAPAPSFSAMLSDLTTAMKALRDISQPASAEVDMTDVDDRLDGLTEAVNSLSQAAPQKSGLDQLMDTMKQVEEFKKVMGITAGPAVPEKKYGVWEFFGDVLNNADKIAGAVTQSVDAIVSAQTNIARAKLGLAPVKNPGGQPPKPSLPAGLTPEFGRVLTEFLAATKGPTTPEGMAAIQYSTADFFRVLGETAQTKPLADKLKEWTETAAAALALDNDKEKAQQTQVIMVTALKGLLSKLNQPFEDKQLYTCTNVVISNLVRRVRAKQEAEAKKAVEEAAKNPPAPEASNKIPAIPIRRIRRAPPPVEPAQDEAEEGEEEEGEEDEGAEDEGEEQDEGGEDEAPVAAAR